MTEAILQNHRLYFTRDISIRAVAATVVPINSSRDRVLVRYSNGDERSFEIAAQPRTTPLPTADQL